MAVSAQALNIQQYAIMSNDPLVSRVTFSLIDNGCVLQDMPIINKKSLIANGVRFEGSLPSVNWAALNTDPTTTSGTPKAFQEQAFIVRNNIDVDRFLVQDENAINDPRDVQANAWLKGYAYDVNDKFINNDPVAGDKNAFTGLAYRIANGSTYGVRPENAINANLDVRTSTLTAAIANQFLEYLDQLLWSVDSEDGQGVVIYCNDVMRRRLATIVRSNATPLLDITKDQYDRPVMSYRNAIIRNIGVKADQSTRIIGNVETAGGAFVGGTQTSLYAVKYSTDYLFGWQFEPLRAQDIGLIGNGGTVYRILFDYAFGLYSQHTRSMARMYNVRCV